MNYICPNKKFRETHPHHKGKGVVALVICADLGNEEEESPSLPIGAIMTLQRSSRFKNIFDQLEFIANECKIAIEALLSIASEVRVDCLTTETRSNRAFLENTNEITFSDKDMEVGYLDHRRPLYLAAFIIQIPIKQDLVDIGTSVNLIPLNILQVAKIPENKIIGYPMEVIGFGGKYTTGYIQLLLKVGPIASLARFHVVKIEVSYHVLLGRP